MKYLTIQKVCRAIVSMWNYLTHLTYLWLLKMYLPDILNDVAKMMSPLQKRMFTCVLLAMCMQQLLVIIVHFSLCRRNSSQNCRPSSFDKEACLSGSQLVSSRSTAGLWSWCFERNLGSWVFYCIWIGSSYWVTYKMVEADNTSTNPSITCWCSQRRTYWWPSQGRTTEKRMWWLPKHQG